MFNQIRDDILRTGANVFRIALYDNGAWHDETLRPVCPNLNCYSVSKSFTATAVGIAQDMGLLSLDDPIVKYFPGEVPDNADEKLARVKIVHLLTQTMGNAAGYLFEADRYTHGTGDWVRHVLSQPLAHEPGTEFAYSNSTFYLLSVIVHRASGMPLDRFIRARLFDPMGIESFAWEACPKGETFGASGLYLHTRDAAKLGVLYLNKGEYEGKRLLSRGFAEDAVRLHVRGGDWARYGLSFWVNDIGYHAGGAYNQIILTVPDRNIVFAAHSFIEGDYDFVGMVKNLL